MVNYFLSTLIRIVYFLLLIRFILSWIEYSKRSKYLIKYQNFFTRFINKLTDPLISPFQGMFPSMSLDLSPIIVFMIIRFFIEPLVMRIFFGF
jgi:uncharacterized protein YggT (Ycf19 family)